MYLQSGLYEQIINLAIAEGLKGLGDRLPVTEPLDSGDAQPILARYLYELLERGLSYLRDKFGEEKGLLRQVDACNKLIELMVNLTDEEDLLDWRIGEAKTFSSWLFRIRDNSFA